MKLPRKSGIISWRIGASRVRLLQFLVLICVVAGGTVVWGQTGLGNITGRVTDASGAVVPGVSVVATNTTTGIQTKSTSNGAGYY